MTGISSHPSFVYFNSQPRKEADTITTFDAWWCDISIHSLARRLTLDREGYRVRMAISIHSLARRLTTQAGKLCHTFYLFQFTASQGG